MYDILRDKYTPPSREIHWLTDPVHALSSVFFVLLQKPGVIVWQDEGQGTEVIKRRAVPASHSSQILCQAILA